MNTQNESKHTPGPWHVGIKPGPILYGTKGEQIADLRGHWLEDSEHMANVRLIAAAPALLEAVKNVPLMWSEQDNKDVIIARFWDWWETLGKPSIDKAEGRI